jgi:hypothetical protein
MVLGVAAHNSIVMLTIELVASKPNVPELGALVMHPLLLLVLLSLLLSCQV